jgi:acetate kinase
MTPLLLVVNAGSSSLKFQVYDQADAHTLAATLGGQISGIGTAHPRFRVRDDQHVRLVDRDLDPTATPDLAHAQQQLIDWLGHHLDREPAAVGHRIVHGGPWFQDSAVITPGVLTRLESLIPLAPLHQRNNLLPVQVIAQRWPNVVQVACFDTAFHRDHAPEVERFALPDRFYQQGVRRYGFHGLSYQYIAEHLGRHYPDLGPRVVAAHLGSGTSACALLNGRSVESTMGFTALDGLPMGTRPGRLDPGVLLWMLEQGMSHDDIQHVLYFESGLKGVSGLSADVRDLLESTAPQARLALNLFMYRTAESLAGLCVALNGLDALVFTAGVGENSGAIRAGICRRLAWLGVRLNDSANARNASDISAPDSRVRVLVVPTNEELVIARQTLAHVLQA